MAEVASAYMSILPSAKGFGRSLESDVSGEVNGAGSSMGKKFGTAFKVGAAAVVGGALIAGKFLKGSLEEAREAQKVTALTNSVIKATGSVANVTAKQVGDLAGALSNKTGIDDEVIQSGQNMLLTFKNIRNEAGKGNDIFNQSTSALVDMSAAMGTEPKQAAIQLGKALNDPIKGISALSRVGIQFTEGQKKTITSLVEGGKTMDAQKIILKELNTQFGGAAEAQATAGDKFRVAWGNLQETVGTALLPVVDKVLTKMTGVAIMLSDNVGPAFRKVSEFVSPLASSLRSVFDGASGGSSFATTLTSVVLPALQSAGSYLRAELLPAVMEVVNAFKYQFQTIAPIVVEAISGMVARIAPHWESIKTALQQVVSTFKSSLELIAVVVRTGTAILQALWSKFGQRFMDYLAKTFNNVVTIVRGALNIVQGVIRLVTSLIKGDWSAAWDAIKQILRGAWQIIEGVVKQGLNTLKFMLSNLGSVLKLLVSKAWDLAKAAFREGVDATIKLAKMWPGMVVKAMGAIGSLLYNAGKELIQGFLNGIASMAGAVADKAKDIANGAVGAVKGALGIKSPSRVFHQIGKWTMEGFEAGIKDAGPKVLKAMQDALDKTMGKVQSFRDGIRSQLDGVRSEFASLRDSIASTFSGDLFNVSAIAESLTETTFTAAQTVGQAFVNSLSDTKGQLQGLLKAFKKLKGWGIPAEFLSQMFASGNSALILEMASGTKAQAASASSLFGDVQSLSNQLGSQVSRNQYGDQINRLDKKLERANRHLRYLDTLAKDIGKALNDASASTQRRPA